MTALPIFKTAKPSHVGRPVLPMSKDDEIFWREFHRRREQKDSKQ